MGKGQGGWARCWEALGLWGPPSSLAVGKVSRWLWKENAALPPPPEGVSGAHRGAVLGHADSYVKLGVRDFFTESSTAYKESALFNS